MSGCPFHFTRRGFLGLAGLAAAAGLGVGAKDAVQALGQNSTVPSTTAAEPFYGRHQSGIVTPIQNNTYFAAFEVMTDKREELIALLKKWTTAAALLAAGKPADPVEHENEEGLHDTGDAAGLTPSRLTLTFGFGPTLFVKNGKDRFGLAAQRPEALIDMPKFNGDQLVPERSDGDLSVQACADDPQVAFHAIRQLVRLASDTALIKWTQSGFLSSPPDGGTPRNLMGFKDGTGNPAAKDPSLMDKYVWVSEDGPLWMQGGSYAVVRRIRVALEHWDKMKVSFQEQTVGRKKLSGAPLGKEKEYDKPDLDLTDKDGLPFVPENSHLRLAAAASNDGAQILRRPFSYNDGVSFTAERWPPWRQAVEYDAGLLFICYQKDPRTGFVKIFDKMSKFDMMNQFATHIASSLFACPGGVKDGEYIGERLFKTA